MSKKLVFLISFVLVLGLCSNALAEDFNPPDWAGAPGSTYGAWEFDEDMPCPEIPREEEPIIAPDPYLFVENPALGLPAEDFQDVLEEWIAENCSELDFTGLYALNWWSVNNANPPATWEAGPIAGRSGLWNCTNTSVDFRNVQNASYKLRMRVQVTYRLESGEEGDGIGWFGEYPGGMYEDPVEIDYRDLGDGWHYICLENEIDVTPDWHSIEFWWEPDDPPVYIDEIILDTIPYQGAEPPDGPGRVGQRGASNPRPEDEEERVDPDGLVLIWDADPCSGQETVYFSSSFSDVNDREEDANQGTQDHPDANYWPQVGDLSEDVNLNEWYYWRINEVNVPIAWDACGPVWSFKVKTAQADWPNPEDEAYAGPCPTLTWDLGAWAVSHRVFFDTDESGVAGRAFDPCYEGGNTFYNPTPPPLDWDTPYFWCVDEVNAGDVCTPGEVWSFTVPRDPCDGPEWRYEDDTFYAIWGFNDWVIGTEPCVASDYNSYPVGFYTFEPNCVDGPNQVLADYTPSGGTIRYHVADNNGPAGDWEYENTIRLKHTDNAMPGQNVIIRAGLIWSGESSPTVVLERLSNWENGPPHGGEENEDAIDDWWEAWEEGDNWKDGCEPDPEFVIELCDGWMYSVYEIEYKLTDPADNIHVVIESSGAFYLDSVMVDAQWYTPPEAHGPRPVDGAVGVPLDLCKLIWYPGAYVDDHNVYFSETEALVADACATAQVGDRQDSNFYPEGADCLADVGIVLEPGVTYYWRVDEVNDPCLWEGAVWSFTTVNYVVIDDFNHYDVDPNMEETWKDHSAQDLWGSYVFRSDEYEPNHSPPYSMEFQYYWKSSTPKLLTQRTFDTPQDWTKGGLAALVLWFWGNADNSVIGGGTDRITATEMFVTLTDDQGHIWKEYYDGDSNDLIAKEWMEWNLALRDFNESPNSVDTGNIMSIDIGVSGIVMSANPLKGRIFFDDIRLYVPRCVPMYAVDISSDPEGPFGGAPDCFVDYWDLASMFDDWAIGDANVQSVDACDANLLVHYTFDADLSDSAGPPYYDGIPIGVVDVHDGILTLVNVEETDDVNAVEIGGDFNDVNPFRGAIKGGGDFTIAMWFRQEEPEERGIFFSSCPYDPCAYEEPNDTMPSNHAMVVFMFEPEGEDLAVSYDNWYVANATVTGSPNDGEWHFLVVTHDADGGIMGGEPIGGQQPGDVTGLTTVYLDGVPGMSEYGTGSQGNFDPNLIDNEPNRHSIRIGTTHNQIMPYEEADDIVDMTGDFNEILIYDRALPHGEIVNLMGVPVDDWFYMPVDSDADLYEDEPVATSLESKRFVNFKDYTYLMQYWLTWQPFPPED